MADTLTTSLQLIQQVTGENEDTWGDNVDTNLDRIEQAIVTTTTKTVTGAGDVTLTTAENRSARLEFTGTLTANQNIIVAANEKMWVVKNGTSGAYTLTVKTSAGTGIAVPQGYSAFLYADGTNVIELGSRQGALSNDLADITSPAQGDVYYYDGSNLVALAAGTSGQFLKTLGAGADPAWDTISGGGDLLSTNNLSDVSNAGTARTNLGVAIGSDVQAYDAGLASIAGLTTLADRMIYTTASDTYAVTTLTSAGRAILDDADASAQRTTLGVAIGSDVQAHSALLDDIAAITFAQGDVMYYDGSDIVNLGPGTSGQFLKTQGAGANPTWDTIAGGGDLLSTNNLSDVANAGTARTNLGVGTADSPQFAALNIGAATDTTVTRTGAGDIAVEGNAIYRAGGTDVPVTDGGTGASTAAGARTNLGLVIGTDVQAEDAGLTSIAGLTTAADRMIYTTASDTYAVATLTSAGRALLDDADASAQRTTLGLDALALLATVGTSEIDDDAVTYAKMQNVVSDDVLLGNVSGAGGVVAELSATTVRTLLNVEDGADVTDATNVAAAGAVMDSDISEGEGFLRKTGAGAYEAIKSNLGASTNPGATDDSAAGYAVGSTWINTTADTAYVLVDATASSAVWVETTAGAAGGISDVVDDTTPQLGGMLDVNGNAIGDGTLELLTFTEDASAVNHVNIENEATGGGPIISAAGDDTNIDLLLAGKGSGVPKIGSNAILDAGDIGVTVQGYDADTALLDVENQALTGGVTVTSKSLGTVTTGTTTLDMGDRPLQHYTNNGAHTLAPGSVNGSCLVDITNGASAGAITTSGWTQVAGDSFDTTNTNKFRCHCSVGDAGSLLIVQAMQ